MDPLIAMYSVQSSWWCFMDVYHPFACRCSYLSVEVHSPCLWRTIFVLYIKTFKAFTHLINFKFRRQLETSCFLITKINWITHSNNTKPLLRLAKEVKISPTFN